MTDLLWACDCPMRFWKSAVLDDTSKVRIGTSVGWIREWSANVTARLANNHVIVCPEYLEVARHHLQANEHLGAKKNVLLIASVGVWQSKDISRENVSLQDDTPLGLNTTVKQQVYILSSTSGRLLEEYVIAGTRIRRFLGTSKNGHFTASSDLKPFLERRSDFGGVALKIFVKAYMADVIIKPAEGDGTESQVMDGVERIPNRRLDGVFHRVANELSRAMNWTATK